MATPVPSLTPGRGPKYALPVQGCRGRRSKRDRSERSSDRKRLDPSAPKLNLHDFRKLLLHLGPRAMVTPVSSVPPVKGRSIPWRPGLSRNYRFVILKRISARSLSPPPRAVMIVFRVPVKSPPILPVDVL